MKILYWSPLPIWPARSGSQVRMASVIDAMVASGHEVHLIAPSRTRRMSWGDSGKDAAGASGIASLSLWEPTAMDAIRMHLLHPVLRRIAPDLEPITRFQASKWLNARISRIVKDRAIDLGFFNYSFSVSLLGGVHGLPTVCDLLDRLVLNYRQQAVCKIRRIDLRNPPSGLVPSSNPICGESWGMCMELDLLKRFEGVVSISENDHRALTRIATTTKKILLPMSFPLAPSTTWPSDPMKGGMLLGDNPLNLEALAWFLRDALPKIRRRHPSYSILLGGTISSRLVGDAEGVESVGSVSDRLEFYQRVGHVLCPTFAGTGEQIKIGEAMSYGRATVGFDWMSSPVRHGLDGFRATSGADFVECVCQLAESPDACAAMGESARQEVSERRGFEAFRQGLDDFLTAIAETGARSDLSGRSIPSGLRRR